MKFLLYPLALIAGVLSALLLCGCESTARGSWGTFQIKGGSGNPCSPVAAPETRSPRGPRLEPMTPLPPMDPEPPIPAPEVPPPAVEAPPVGDSTSSLSRPSPGLWRPLLPVACGPSSRCLGST
jgi:hypothetical protein